MQDEEENTPLHVAVLNNQVEIATLLKDERARLDIKNKRDELASESANTATMRTLF